MTERDRTEHRETTQDTPMADLPPNPGSPPSTPRWVKAFGIIAIILVLLFVVLLLTRGGHGPGRHIPSDDSGGHTPSIEHEAQQP